VTKSKSFLIPVSAAVAALFPGWTAAAVTQHESIDSSLDNDQKAEAAKPNADTVVGKIPYQIGDEEHALVLRHPEHGGVYADHSSHASHSSHSSHRSGS
jgi:hypothetical protein